MQTFLPYPEFSKSAAVLDDKRLGKQRVETLQILNALNGESKGWVNHPATRMWRGHEAALMSYGVAVCLEWMARGYDDTVLPKIIEVAAAHPPTSPLMPPWLGDEAFHRSHQSNLVRKDKRYEFFFPDVPEDLEYVWPVP